MTPAKPTASTTYATVERRRCRRFTAEARPRQPAIRGSPGSRRRRRRGTHRRPASLIRACRAPSAAAACRSARPATRRRNDVGHEAFDRRRVVETGSRRPRRSTAPCRAATSAAGPATPRAGHPALVNRHPEREDPAHGRRVSAGRRQPRRSQVGLGQRRAGRPAEEVIDRAGSALHPTRRACVALPAPTQIPMSCAAAARAAPRGAIVLRRSDTPGYLHGQDFTDERDRLPERVDGLAGGAARPPSPRSRPDAPGLAGSKRPPKAGRPRRRRRPASPAGAAGGSARCGSAELARCAPPRT